MATSYSLMLGLPAPPVTQVRRVCLPLLLLPTCATPRIRALRHCSTWGNPRHDVLHAHVLLFQCLRNAPLPCPGSGGWRGQPHLLCAIPAPQRHQGGRLLWHAAPLSHAAASPPTRAHSEALSAACSPAPRTHPPTHRLSRGGSPSAVPNRSITVGMHTARPAPFSANQHLPPAAAATCRFPSCSPTSPSACCTAATCRRR